MDRSPMEKVVLQLVEDVTKTSEKQALEDRCLKALSKLCSIPVSSQFLLSTNIGHTISSLESNPRRKQIIRDYASRVLTKWKRQLYSRSSLPNPNPKLLNPPPNPNPNVHHKNNSTLKLVRAKSLPKPSSKKLSKLKRQLYRSNPHLSFATKPNPDPPNNPNPNPKHEINNCSQPPPKKSGKNLKPTPKQQLVVKRSDDDTFRNNIKQQIFEGLDMALNEGRVNRDPIGVAMSVESILHDKWGTFFNNTSMYRSFIYNLKDPKNPDFRRKILIGELKQETIPLLKPEDMASDQKRCQIQNIRETSLNKSIVGRDEFQLPYVAS